MASKRSKSAPSQSKPAPPEPAGSMTTAGTVFWGLLAVLFLARAATAGIPGAYGWGLDALRHLDPWAWVLWGIALAALVPPIARPLARGLEALGRVFDRQPIGSLSIAAATAVLVFQFPDNVRYVGDYLLRQGSAEIDIAPSRLYPQALPLDVIFHYLLPVWASDVFDLRANETNRWLGVLNAAIVAALSYVFAGQLGVRGGARLAVAAMTWLGGWLLLCTGYAKAFSELTWLILGAAIIGLDVLRGNRSFVWYAVWVGIAVWLHRSALGFLPSVFILAWLAPVMATSAAKKGKKKPKSDAAAEDTGKLRLPLAKLVGILLVTGSLAFVMPQLIASFQAIDAKHFTGQTGEVGRSFGTLLNPLRLLDEFNVLLWLVPLAPLLFYAVRPRGELKTINRDEVWFLLSLSLPFISLLFLMTPVHGLYRDFDTFAMTGMAVALWVAIAAAEFFRRERAGTWLTAAVFLGALVPAVHHLALATDLDRGLARIEAWVKGPPLRSEPVQALTWDYLGVRNFQNLRYDESMRSFRRAVELAPSPRLCMQWAMAAESAGDWAVAREAYEKILERTTPDDETYYMTGLVGAAKASGAIGDIPAFHMYADSAEAHSPDHPAVKQFIPQWRAQIEAPQQR